MRRVYSCRPNRAFLPFCRKGFLAALKAAEDLKQPIGLLTLMSSPDSRGLLEISFCLKAKASINIRDAYIAADLIGHFCRYAERGF